MALASLPNNTKSTTSTLSLVYWYFLQLSSIILAGFSSSDSHMPPRHTSNMQYTAAPLCHAHSTFIDCTEPTHYALNWTKYTTSNNHIWDLAGCHFGTRCAARPKAMLRVPTGELSTKVHTAPTNRQKLRQSPLCL